MNHLFTEAQIKQQTMQEAAAAHRRVRAVESSRAAKKERRIPLTGGYTQFILALVR